MASNRPLAVCIVVENESLPFDRRVWLEACTLKRAGYEVSIICPKDDNFKKSHEVLDGVEIHRYWSWSSRGKLGHIIEYVWSFMAQLFWALRVYARRHFRILQVCNPPDTGFLIGLVFKLFGVRFLFDHHDLTPELYVVRFGPRVERSLLYRLACAAERLTFWTADFCLATNESYFDVAVNRGRMKPERVAVVQTCADLADVNGKVTIHERTENQRFRIVYVGNMEPQDGVDLLLESIRYLAKELSRNNIVLQIIGAGSELHRLQKLCFQFGLNGMVEFTGRIPHCEVDSYLSAADICVAPDPLNSLNDKCSMIKIFEYMAHGKPIVLFDLKEGRRSAGDAALYARPNDPKDFGKQILHLLDSDSLRRKLGECGRRRVQDDLNWEVQSKRLLEAYKDVLSL